MTKASVRLITIPASHYCEKARWALDRSTIVYEEIRHLQIFHYGSTLLHGHSLYVPVLVTSDESLTDSTDILRWVDARLAPGQELFPSEPNLANEVRAWEDLFDTTLGVDARRWLYQRLFEHLSTDEIVAFATQGVPQWEALLMKPLLPFAKYYLGRRLKVDASSANTAIDAVRSIFDRVGNQIRGREFLVGDRFTAADLSFASLSALVLMPTHYGVRLLDVPSLPSPMRSVIDELRDTDAGLYALRLYEHHRHPKVAI